MRRRVACSPATRPVRSPSAQYFNQYRNKLRAGDVGSLPALLGLLLLIIVFTIAAPSPS